MAKGQLEPVELDNRLVRKLVKDIGILVFRTITEINRLSCGNFFMPVGGIESTAQYRVPLISRMLVSDRWRTDMCVSNSILHYGY